MRKFHTSLAWSPRSNQSSAYPVRESSLDSANCKPTRAASFRHRWSDERRTGVDSICTCCFTLIAGNLDEMALLELEAHHRCSISTQETTC